VLSRKFFWLSEKRDALEEEHRPKIFTVKAGVDLGLGQRLSDGTSCFVALDIFSLINIITKKFIERCSNQSL